MSEQHDRLTKLQELNRQAAKVAMKSLELRNRAETNAAKVLAFDTQYPSLDDLDWQEKEKAIAIAEQLLTEMNVIEAEIRECEKEYELVRNQVNAIVGREVLPKVNIKWEKPPADESDAADWWKSAE